MLGLAVASAVLQLAIATRWGGRSEYISVLILGWCGALFLSWLRRVRLNPCPRWPEVLGGGAVWIAACATTAVTYGAYHTASRFVPLAAGLGLVVASSGIRRVPGYWRELMLLSLTFVYPLPFAIQQVLMPTRLTAASVVAVVRMMGLTVTRDQTVLRFPETTLRVFDSCSGLVLMTQVLVLAVLVLAFFQTTLRRTAIVVMSGLVAGFIVNVARIALLALVASHVPSDFDYWENYVAGSVLFPVLAVSLSGALWWRVLRTPAGERTMPPQGNRHASAATGLPGA